MEKELRKEVSVAGKAGQLDLYSNISYKSELKKNPKQIKMHKMSSNKGE